MIRQLWASRGDTTSAASTSYGGGPSSPGTPGHYSPPQARTQVRDQEQVPGSSSAQSRLTQMMDLTKRSLMVGVTEGAEVQAGAGEEALEEGWPVLHPPEPGLNQGGQLGEVAFGQVSQGPFQVRPHRFDRVKFVRIGRQLADGQPVPGRDQLGHRGADVGIEVVPHDYQGAGKLLVGGVQQLGVVRLGEPFALVLAMAAAVVHAVDQPGPAPGLDSDERSERDALVAAAGDPHHRGGAAPAPGTSFRRP